MAKVNSFKQKIFKTDAGEIVIPNISKYEQLLQNLVPGTYTLIIEPRSERLERMKKYYFVMETSLSKHLGIKKPELHAILKKHVGHKVDEGTGNAVYESIADIKDEDTMMHRIYEFQNFAAKQFKYTFEPFHEE